jgi:glycosyltransferase involved in cell wall biosynthesis
MKLAFLSYNRDPSLPSIDTDGCPDTVRHLALELALFGHRVDVYANKIIPTKEDNKYLQKKYRLQNEDVTYLDKKVKVTRMSTKRLPYRDIYNTKNSLDVPDIVDSYLSAQKYKDILCEYDYVCVFHPLAGMGVLLGGLSSPSKTVLFPMLLSDEYKKYQEVSEVYCDLEQKVLEMAKAILSGSEEEMKTLESKGINKSKLYLVGRGYDDSIFKGRIRNSMVEKKDKVVISCIGSIRPQKNQLQLVEIAQLLVKNGFNPIVNIIGDNQNFPNSNHKKYYESILKEINRLGLKKNFNFKGYVKPKKIAEILSETDFAILPSRAESFGKAALECICVGVPTIIRRDVLAYKTFAEGGVNAIFVDGSSISFVDSVLDLLNNPVRYRRICQNGVNTGRSYAWKDVAKKIEVILENLR